MGIDYYKTLGDTSFITGRHARTALGITSYNKSNIIYSRQIR